METRRRGGLRRASDYNSETVSRMGSTKPSSRSCTCIREQTTAGPWEKSFCKVVGSMDWETFLKKKECIYWHDNVLKWNDSANREAFHNAKDRFFALISGRPCDLPLPDLDIYIDRIDWDSKVDEEMLWEACQDTKESYEPVLIFGDEFLRSKGFSWGGWDDCEEDLKINAENPSSDKNNNPWENYRKRRSRGNIVDSGWGTWWPNSGCWKPQNRRALPEYGESWRNENGKKNKISRFERAFRDTSGRNAGLRCGI